MTAIRNPTLLLSSLLLILITLTPTYALSQPSIPINGRYSTLTIKIYIPAYPKWAHDVVLNATVAWNQAQLRGLQSSTPLGVYNLVEASEASATSIVSFTMPKAYASIAVGWTNYKFARGSRTSIISTQTYLNPSIFNAAQESNATARRYAFWLALHELGRILGLGSLLDGKDIMEPRYTAERINQVPTISTLDLYALQVLAEGTAPAFVTLPSGVQQRFTPVSSYLDPIANNPLASGPSSSFSIPLLPSPQQNNRTGQ